MNIDKMVKKQLNILKPESQNRKIIKSCKRATAASSILITILAVLAVKYMSSDFRRMAVVAELEH